MGIRVALRVWFDTRKNRQREKEMQIKPVMQGDQLLAPLYVDRKYDDSFWAQIKAPENGVLVMATGAIEEISGAMFVSEKQLREVIKEINRKKLERKKTEKIEKKGK